MPGVSVKLYKNVDTAGFPTRCVKEKNATDQGGNGKV